MGDERKDQNLPARPASSLMGQLVRQRQGGEVVPAQQGATGLAGKMILAITDTVPPKLVPLQVNSVLNSQPTSN
jgi:hypothetical protein